MTYLHYIWYGPVPADPSKYATANNMALACPEQRVLFWCKREYLDGFRAVLDPSIQVLPCDELDALAGQALGGDMPRWYAEALQVLGALNQARAWSACKDLVSLLVLYSYGGYYMDTTTLIIPSVKGPALNAGFEATYDSPRVPRLGDDTVRHQPFLQTGVAIVTGGDFRAGDDGMLNVPLIDVWAFYSPSHDECTSWMIMSYVSRCNRLGINDNGTPSNFDAISGLQELNDVGRDTLIGQLIIRSVYDGLIEQAYRELGEQGNNNPDDEAVGQQVTAYTWPTIKLPSNAPANWELPALNIDKRYANSWRNQGNQQQ